MPRLQSSVDPDLLATAPVSMDQLVRALERLAIPTPSSSFKAPTVKGEGEVELFIEQCRDVAEENRCTKKRTLLHLRRCLEGTARTYSQRDSVQEIFEMLRTRHDMSSQQAGLRMAA